MSFELFQRQDMYLNVCMAVNIPGKKENFIHIMNVWNTYI